MKKITSLIMFVFITTTSHGQWTYKIINSAFDGSFKKAYTATNNNGVLMMEVDEVITEANIEYLRKDTSFAIIGYVSKRLVNRINDLDSNLYKVDKSDNVPVWDNVSIGSANMLGFAKGDISLIEDVDNKFYKVKTTTANKIIYDSIKHESRRFNVPILYLKGLYFCDDGAYIDFVFVVNGVNKKYILFGSKIKSNTYVFQKSKWSDEFIWSDDFTKDFKNASKCLIRVNQEYCDDVYYEFNFSGSTAAYNYITR